MAYNRGDKAIVFEVDLEVTDDVLIRCRHYRSENERVSVFRLMFSPYFAFDEVTRLYSVSFLPIFFDRDIFCTDY